MWKAFLVALVLGAGLSGVALAGPSAPSTQSLTASSGVLQWTVGGDAPSASVKVFKAGSSDCAGAHNCIIVSDPDAGAPASVPSGCAATAAGASCDETLFTGVSASGDGTGRFAPTTTFGGSSYLTCPAGSETITENGGDGQATIDDGCAQTVHCASAYTGKIVADRTDAIDDTCAWVTVDGVEMRHTAATTTTTAPATQSTPAPAPPHQAAPSGTTTGSGTTAAPKPYVPAASPPVRDRGHRNLLGKVRLATAARHRFAVSLTVSGATKATVSLQRRDGRAWRAVTKATLVATKAQTLKCTLGTKPLTAGVYRVTVTSKDSSYPLVSSTLALR